MFEILHWELVAGALENVTRANYEKTVHASENCRTEFIMFSYRMTDFVESNKTKLNLQRPLQRKLHGIKNNLATNHRCLSCRSALIGL